MDKVDAHLVRELFPCATMFVWGAPHWHVADARDSCSPKVRGWSSNDDYNLEAFAMLQGQCPDAEVVIPFPAHYAKAANSPRCRALQVPVVDGQAYRPLCSDPRWYQPLTSTEDVVCLTSADFLSEVRIVDRVRRHLRAGGQVVFLGEFSFMLSATVALAVESERE